MNIERKYSFEKTNDSNNKFSVISQVEYDEDSVYVNFTLILLKVERLFLIHA